MAELIDPGESPVGIVANKTWQATMKLRVVKPIQSIGPILGGTSDFKLQQLWQCRETGVVEWRDVEVVRE